MTSRHLKDCPSLKKVSKRACDCDLRRAEKATADAAKRISSPLTGRIADVQTGYMSYDDFGNK